ncbi:MAG: ABC transporter ATP-binding protein [Erysipelotrichaceae bacterium]|nr:ABC transporter ATP-binding protein [Erysipelotrichaceae bacterium]
MTNENFIELIDVTKKYKEFTLSNVSFVIPAGSIVGFIGENGAGKSTTMKSIVDLIKFDSGTINIFGKPLKELTPSEREDIGVVLDEICLPEKLPIKLLQKVFANIFKNWSNEIFSSYLKKFGISEDKKISDLSKGMKAKLNLSIAFSHKSKLLILDEPMNGLDPVARDDVMEILTEFVKDKEHSVLISSHIISDLEKICNHIVIIHDGKIMINEDKKALLSLYDVFSCSTEDANKLDKENLFRIKTIGDSTEILTKKAVFTGENVKPATIEDIMIFMIRGKTL